MTRPVAYLLDRYLQTSQTFVSNEIDEMRAQGVEVVVVALRRGDRDLPDDDRVLILEDIPLGRHLWRAHVRWLRRHPLRYLRFLLRVVQLRKDMGSSGELLAWQRLPLAADHLARLDAQELHAHFAWWGATAAACLAPLLGLRWSVVLHAKDIFSKQRSLRPKLRLADTVITVCDYNLQWMREHLAVTRPVELVICGVRLPSPDEPTIAEADVVVVGRLIEKKGIDVLLDAAAELRVTHPGLRVDVIGEGPLRESLEQRSRELGLGTTVRFLGRVPHEEVLQRIGGARVFCLPARIAADGDRDSMPVVIKEAMVRRVPVVGSAVAAVPEMLGDGCGLLVPPDDAPALAAALGRLLDDEGLRADVTERAWVRASSRFVLSSEVARLRRLIVDGT